jgi:hypothetical protein
MLSCIIENGAEVGIKRCDSGNEKIECKKIRSRYYEKSPRYSSCKPLSD